MHATACYSSIGISNIICKVTVGAVVIDGVSRQRVQIQLEIVMHRVSVLFVVSSSLKCLKAQSTAIRSCRAMVPALVPAPSVVKLRVIFSIVTSATQQRSEWPEGDEDGHGVKVNHTGNESRREQPYSSLERPALFHCFAKSLSVCRVPLSLTRIYVSVSQLCLQTFAAVHGAATDTYEATHLLLFPRPREGDIIK